ncbi:MAG: Mth938-like domain-containing protein [Candidatus Aminicenantes bacterium]|nr:Mth938-like domain-containing protein [Candidatus Aminicenantes bacterium]
MRIEDYSFGKMVIGGKTYTKDLKVFPDKIKENWWRKEGHHLYVDDIADIIEYNPEVLVVGRGAYGFMKIDKEVEEKLKELGIELIAEKTARAVEKFNKFISEGKKVCGAFHLTC